MMKSSFIPIVILLTVILAGCRAYKQDIMFKVDEAASANLQASVDQAERNYHLQADDMIQVDVFTNSGERLIDPNFELTEGVNAQMAQQKEKYQYLIQLNGVVKLPMVGDVKVAGLTIDEAEDILEQAYDESYVESFVKIRVLNRRVVVLGGEGGQVIPIENENTSLLEILALYGGLNLGSKAENVRVIRGDLTNPDIYKIDLSTISGMKSTIIDVEAGDIIYIEPWRRPWLESVKDVAPIFSVATSILTLVVVIQNL